MRVQRIQSPGLHLISLLHTFLVCLPSMTARKAPIYSPCARELAAVGPTKGSPQQHVCVCVRRGEGEHHYIIEEGLHGSPG